MERNATVRVLSALRRVVCSWQCWFCGTELPGDVSRCPCQG